MATTCFSCDQRRPQLARDQASLDFAQPQPGNGARGPRSKPRAGAAGNRHHFPPPLLQLDPALIKQRISAALPVDQVLMQRQMLPPRLLITLSERAAVAKAQRNGIGGAEQGFIDRTGRWISPRQQAGAMGAALPNLKVVGWQSRYQPSLELLIGVLPKEADVRELRFEANGDLWVVSSKLGAVRFGPLDERLGRRVQVLSHLSRS